MLTASGYGRWHARLGLDARAIALVDGIRASPPSRRVSSGRGALNNVCARFPSIKMGHILQAESRTIELAYLRLADRDLDVLEIWDQPPQIELRYRSKGGRPLTVMHTPDMFVLWQDRAGWVECKPLASLASLAQTQPNRYSQDEDGTWRCPPGEAYAAQFGLSYTIVTDAQLDPIVVRNFEFLDDYYRGLDSPPGLPEGPVAQALAAVANKPGLTKRELALQDPPIDMDTIHWLIVRGDLYVDLARCPLVDADHVRVYLDSDQAQMYDLVADTPPPAWSTRTEPIRCEPGTPLVWDGKPWLITNVGDTRIFLELQDGTSSTPIAMDRTQWQRLEDAGHISAVHIEGGHAQNASESVVDAQWRLLMNARPETFQRALCRYRQLQRFLAGDLTVLDEVCASSLYTYQRRWRAAEVVGRPGFAGLVDGYARSGRASPLSPEVHELLETSVREDYGSKKQLTVRAAYGAYLGRCDDAGLEPVTYETYRITLLQQPPAEQTQARRGRRAAYGIMPFLGLGLGNRHGDYPLQRSHADHTQLDVEVVSGLGEFLGRPWLTLLFDAYSRRVLAFYLTFDAPSYRSCMMMVRECVRRFKRLPMTMVLDNGKEFHSVYFEELLATFNVTQESRPAAKPRFGSVIERMFGTLNKQLIHTLQGNTQVMRNVREVTKSVNPRGQAVWTLPALFDALTEWCFEVYDQNPHAGLRGRSPREVFLAGQAQAGMRDHSPIPFDDDFLRLTEPSTPKGTARFSPRGIAKVNYILYYCPKLARRVKRGKGTDVLVRFDPQDLGHIHALVDDKWEFCRANNYDVFSFRSQREIALAAEEIRALDRQAGRESAVTHARLVTFFQKVQQHEAVLRQHLRDQEVRRALAGNAAGVVDAEVVDGTFTTMEAPALPDPLDADANRIVDGDVSTVDDEDDEDDEDPQDWEPCADF